jgi:hypothetical protein
MSRLAEGYSPRPRSAEGRHSRTEDQTLQPARGLAGRTAGMRGRQTTAASGWNAERHDWLVPLELP